MAIVDPFAQGTDKIVDPFASSTQAPTAQAPVQSTPAVKPATVAPVTTQTAPAPGPVKPESKLFSTFAEIPRLASETAAGFANLPVKAFKGYEGLAATGKSLIGGEDLDTALQKGSHAIGNRNPITSRLDPSKTSQFLGQNIIQPAIQKLSDVTGQPELVQGIAEVGGDIASLMGLRSALPTISNAVSKVAGKVATGAEQVGTGILGATTGTSKRLMQEAISPANDADFVKYLRSGEEGGREIVENAKNAVQMVRKDMGNRYRARLQQLSQNMQPITDAPQLMNRALNSQLNEYRIKMVDVLDENGVPTGEKVPNFRYAGIDKKSQNDVADIINKVRDWGSQPEDLLPINMDAFRKELDDFYSDSRNSRAMVSSLRDKVNKIITEKVPEYQEMTQDYDKTTGLIKEMEGTLSLGRKPMIDTTMRKLTSAMRDSFPFRSEVLRQLQDATGENLESAIAGYNLSSLTPTSGLGKLGLGIGFGGGVAQIIAPHYLPMLALSSPRVVAEVLRGLGLAGKTARSIAGKLPMIRNYVKTMSPTAAGITSVGAGLAQSTTLPQQQQQTGFDEGGEIPGEVKPGAGDNIMTPMQTGEYVTPVDAIVAKGRELYPSFQLSDQDAHSLGKNWFDTETERLKQLAGNPTPPNNAGVNMGYSEGGMIKKEAINAKQNGSSGKIDGNGGSQSKNGEKSGSSGSSSQGIQSGRQGNQETVKSNEAQTEKGNSGSLTLRPAVKKGEKIYSLNKDKTTHDDIIRAKSLGLKATDNERGFIDPSGKWLDRTQAMDYLSKSKPALFKTLENEGIKELRSEDLQKVPRISIKQKMIEEDL